MSVFVARGECLWLCSCRGRAVSGRGELQLGGDASYSTVRNFYIYTSFLLYSVYPIVSVVYWDDVRTYHYRIGGVTHLIVIRICQMP